MSSFLIDNSYPEETILFDNKMDTQDRFDQLCKKLRERHYRMTPQRMVLVRLIAASKGHPSAARLYQQVKTEFPMMNQTTVYKTLDLLKELAERTSEENFSSAIEATGLKI